MNVYNWLESKGYTLLATFHASKLYSKRIGKLVRFVDVPDSITFKIKVWSKQRIK